MKISPGSKKNNSSQDKKPLSGDEVLARNQAARKNSRPLLDPHGIYGTRSAYRVRTAQKRRRAQFLFVLLCIVAVGGGATLWARNSRIPRLKTLWRKSLATQPVGLPAWGTVSSKGADPGVFMVVPTERGLLLSVDASNGGRSVAFSTALALRAQPLVVGATAYAPCDDGSLFAIDWQNEKTIWNYHSEASVSARPAYLQVQSAAPVSPAESNPAAPRQAIVVTGDDAGNIAALNAQTGKPLWRTALQAPVGNGLTAVEGVTGGGPGGSKVLVPLLAGLGFQGGVACLDGATGRIVWKADLGAAFLPAPAQLAGGGVTKIYCVGDNGSVVCLDAETGRRLWKAFARPLEQNGQTGVVLRGEPLVASIGTGAAIVCGGIDGGVRAFDSQNGNLLWTFNAGAPVRCRPRSVSLKDGNGTARDVLLIGSDSNYAFGLEARSGNLAWRCETTGTAFATPGVHQGAVVCLTREGTVETFALPS